MRLSEIIKYYSKPGIIKEIARASSNREIGVAYGLNRFGKRPDVIQFPAEVKGLARKGATSFHASEEIWSDPLKLSPESTMGELDELRTGWDFIIDIDCKLSSREKSIEYAKETAILLLNALEHHGIKGYSVKFSGGSGFHIGVPFEAMPKQFRKKPINLLFPDAARVMAEYLAEFIKPHLSDRLISIESDLKKISELSGKGGEDLIEDGQFNPYSVLEIDTVLISSRHLFRLPYSLNEKTWLSSVVLDKDELPDFTMDKAKPEVVSEVKKFLDPEMAKENEISQLLVQSFDWKSRTESKKEDQSSEKNRDKTHAIEGKITEENFPNCIKKILNGLEDGRKRALFILINFLRSLNWDWPEIESKINEWNGKNREPLRKGYILSQINWSKRQGKRLPPNCSNAAYYDGIGVGCNDEKCKKFKNPVISAASNAKRRAKKEDSPKPS